MSFLHIPSIASVDFIKFHSKLVLLRLGWLASDIDDSCSPTITDIAGWCSMSRQGVLNQLAKLEASGLIRVKHSPGRHTNQYQLTVKHVDCCDSPTVRTVDCCQMPQRSTALTVESTSNYTDYKGTDMDRFKKPDLVELKFHAVKIGLPEPEAEKFFNYYESNGWRVGKSPMKQWKSAMANWKLNWEQWRSKQTNYVNPRNPTGSPL